MIKNNPVTPPFFEIGPKAYLFGKDALMLAQHADRMSEKYHVSIIFTPQYVDIPLLVKKTRNLFIFAQHMDSLRIGRGIGSVLPEAVKAAGAKGVLLNHAEKKLEKTVIRETIERADEVGLISMVCADDEQDALEIARLDPNIIIVESPELIGTGKRSKNDRTEIERVNRNVWAINPDILILHGAGVSSGKDVYQIIASGSQGSGSTSGIIQAEEPFTKLEEMVKAVREAWDKRHSTKGEN
jgi:triosephosphate isomerase